MFVIYNLSRLFDLILLEHISHYLIHNLLYMMYIFLLNGCIFYNFDLLQYICCYYLKSILLYNVNIFLFHIHMSQAGNKDFHLLGYIILKLNYKMVCILYTGLQHLLQHNQDWVWDLVRQQVLKLYIIHLLVENCYYIMYIDLISLQLYNFMVVFCIIYSDQDNIHQYIKYKYH